MVKIFKPILGLVILHCFVLAQQGTWQYIGLPNENITAIAINSQNDSIVYAGSYSDFSAGTFGSIFKSNDAGISWDSLVYGVSVNQLEINPRDPNIVYAAYGGANFSPPGILKTTDGGMTWFWADSGIYVNPETFVQSIAIDPFYPDTLYAGTGGIFSGTLYKSVNGGLFWADIGIGTGLIDGVVSIAINPQNSNIIFATTAWNCLLYKSTNGGLDWQEIIPTFAGYLVYSLVIDPVSTNILYAGASLSGLYKSVDAGLNWFRSDSGISGQSGMDIVINPLDPSVLYAGSYSQGVFYSSDSGASWTAMNNGLDTLWIRTLAITTDGKTLFAGTYDGIYKYDLTLLNIVTPKIGINRYKLYANYPNPFNAKTYIEYDLPRRTFVKLTIYNLLGQEIKELVNTVQPTGHYHISWDGTDTFGNPASSGVFIYHLETQEYFYSRKMIYLK